MNQHLVRLSIADIDAKTIANSLVHGVRDNLEIFVPTYISILATGSSGVTGDPTISVGTNSPNFDNWLAGASMVLDPAPFQRGFVPAVAAPPLISGEAVYVRVSTAATGTTLIFEVHILGFYTNNYAP